MKIIRCVPFLVVGLLSLRGAPQPAESSVDAEFAAVGAFDNMASPGDPRVIGWEKCIRWEAGREQAKATAALAFYAAHPTDPRRWSLALGTVFAPPLFIKGFGPDLATKGPSAIIHDEAAEEAWEKQGDVLIQALLASTDATPELRESAEWYLFARDFRAVSEARSKGEPFDYTPFRARFDAHVSRYSQLGIVSDRALDYLGALEKACPGTTQNIWRNMLDSKIDVLRETADKQIKYLDLMTKPLEMTYTAVDGREVDLKELRGKVVLIDFWATWCGPCKAELPNVVANYQKFHDKGFEVIGVSLENARIAKGDTPEQKAAKLATAKKVLTDFTAAKEMPWPQYFDGKFWDNEISAKYAVDSIPAMFLLDQTGKIVSTNARGPRLEAEIKRLLKI